MIILHEKLLESESKKQSHSASPSSFFKAKWFSATFLISSLVKFGLINGSLQKSTHFLKISNVLAANRL